MATEYFDDRFDEDEGGGRKSRAGRVLLIAVLLVIVLLAVFFVEDWHQLISIAIKPDNIPITALLPLVIFFTWLGLKQARDNDRLADELEADPQLAKTHHRKTLPWRPGWARELHVWPYLIRVEFLAAIIVTIILYVWSITLNAPLEEPANPNLTMNPSKAPWYFLGLQEMLVYFDPWIAGVVMPSLLIVGLMVFPYVDSNPLGNGYYSWKQRRFAIAMFLWGFFMWITLIIIGTFVRGPGWIWFWPGQRWDHNAVVYDRNVDLHEYFGITSMPAKLLFGAIVVGGFYIVGGLFFHWLMKRGEFKLRYITHPREFMRWARHDDEFEKKLLARTSILQYLTFQFFAITVLLAMPVKLILRLLPIHIKYVWVTPWFNI